METKENYVERLIEYELSVIKIHTKWGFYYGIRRISESGEVEFFNKSHVWTKIIGEATLYELYEDAKADYDSIKHFYEDLLASSVIETIFSEKVTVKTFKDGGSL